MAAALLKDHLGVELPHPHQGHAVLLDLKGGEGPLHTGDLTLLIAQGIAVRLPLQKALGDQFHGLPLGPLEGLLAPDGDNDIILRHKTRPRLKK